MHRIPISPHSCHHLLSSIVLIVAILMAARWHFIVVLICIPLMDSDVDHLFMCLFVICISSMEKWPFPSPELGYFSVGFLCFLFKSFLHILGINVLSGI